MIQGLRIKFIKIALAALTGAMILVTLVINAVNWFSVQGEINDTMNLISHNDGRYPLENVKDDRFAKNQGVRIARESPYETRFFSMKRQSDGTYAAVDMTHIATVTEEQAAALAREAFDSGNTTGFLDNFLYLVKDKGGFQIVVFLDCETKLKTVESLAIISGIACVAGILLALLFVSLVSKKAIGPILENVEKQKQFITDAGHELKTPLSVISANMDILSQDLNGNEWVKSTQKQVKLLRDLVGELVFLSRMEEETDHIAIQSFNLSAALSDTAAPFAAMAEFQGKELAVESAEDIVFRGDEGMFRRLISVLLDNAVKYAPDGDTIRVSLHAENRKIVLRTANRLTEPMDPSVLARLFDRFYRADQSRSKENGKSGYGIGLAVAKAIVEKHGGKIHVQCPSIQEIQFACTFPQPK